MNTTTKNQKLPENFYLLQDGLDDESRSNRLCVCLSDVHFTDDTVGNQSAETVIWEEVFDTIFDRCKAYDIKELTLILAGDVVDMIRTARWAQNDVYPWQREHPRFKETLREIMRGIIVRHAQQPSGDANEKTGFFYLLQHWLPQNLQPQCTVQTLVMLGNHDKEIFADDECLKMLYEQCLGQPVNQISAAYRRWIGNMYFNDPKHYDDPDSVPRLPFYWGDQGFRLFVTHGQWRDEDNSRRIQPQSGKPGWQVKDGWRPDIWQALDYAPFTQACFGDTVAAGVLSGFIYRSNEQLAVFKNNTNTTEQQKKALSRLENLLNELDLYRPTYAAIQRIIEETWRLREETPPLPNIRAIIEEELLNSVYTWLDWDFTLESSTPARRLILRVARVIVSIVKFLGARIEIDFIYGMMSLLNRLQLGIFQQNGNPSYKEMERFPAFLQEYRDYGFRIHGEGHTHIPLQEELCFDKPEENPNYTYINFGTWRDQIVPKLEKSYRKRGVGRALSVMDLARKPDSGERCFAYWVEDVLHWNSEKDDF